MTPGSKPRVLVADDHLPLLKAMTRLLAPYCDVVGGAASAAELFELARLHCPAVIVVDVHLPDLNGIEACRQLRAAESAVKIIIVTAFEDSDVRTAARDAGASDVVVKSAIPARLLGAVLDDAAS